MKISKKSSYPQIASIVGYLRKIDTLKLSGYISRGESRKFDTFDSGMFRPGHEYRTCKPFVTQYYDYICNTLTEVQKKHFLAFSQHHGIPTNLLDFSISPLVSLFFACQKSRNDVSDNGYVYFINNRRLVNMGEHIAADINCIKELLSTAEQSRLITQEFFDKIELVGDAFTGIMESPIRDATEEYVEVLQREVFKGESADVILCNLRDEYSDRDIGLNFLSKLEQSCRHHYQYDSEFIDFLLVFNRYVNALPSLCPDKRKEFTLPFYLTYNPPSISQRIDNQSSVFVQQQFIIGDKAPVLCIQKIIPDEIFEITNKSKILEELDCLGINAKYIYNDYDSIAQYVKGKVIP